MGAECEVQYKEAQYRMQRVEPFDKDKWKSCCGSNRPTRASMENGCYKLFEWLIYTDDKVNI